MAVQPDGDALDCAFVVVVAAMRRWTDDIAFDRHLREPLRCYAVLVVLRDKQGDTEMKFGMRRPSLRGMISARTSPARFVRHNLGLKAPRGWGWLTNPKRAAYNRVYSRTTFSLWDLLKKLFGGR